MEPAEYDRIAGKYLDSVYRATLTYCKNKENAEDAVQNAFMKLFVTDTEFTDDEHIKRWLIRAAVNECKNVFMSFRYKKIISIDDIEKEPSYTDKIDEGSELFTVISKLPQNYSNNNLSILLRRHEHKTNGGSSRNFGIQCTEQINESKEEARRDA